MRSAAALAIGIALSAASTASAATAWVPVDVSQPHVAVNASGDAVAVGIRWDGTNSIIQAAVRRSGERFPTGLDLSAPGDDASDADADIDDAGGAVVVWVRGGVVQAATRRPGGSFSAPVGISAGPGRAGVPDVAVSRGGDSVVAWTQAGRIKAATRPADGSFSPPTDLSAAGISAGAPRVAIDAAGGAVAVWRRFTAGSAAIQHAIRPAGGSFSAPADLSAPGGHADTPQLAMDAAGNAVAVWQQLNGTSLVIQAASRRAGAGFSPVESLSALGRNARSPQVALGAGGDAVVVWARQIVGTPEAPDEIQAATRTGAGSFSAPVDLSGKVPGGPSVAPQVAMDHAGGAVVVWRRYLLGVPYLQAATRAAGGEFSRPTDLRVPPDTFVLNPRLVMDGSGNALAVWTAFTGATPVSSAVQAAVYDVSPPRLDDISIPASGVVGRPVSFSVASFDAWTSTSSAWSFGDGGVGSGSTPSHTFTTPGSYRVAVAVRDAAGNVTERAGEIAIARDTPLAQARAGRVRLTGLRIAPAAFARRARVSYRLNRPATVRFRARPRGRHGRPEALRGSFTRASAAGLSRFTFGARQLGRRLRAGRYHLVAIPVAGGVRGHGGRAPFRVLRSARPATSPARVAQTAATASVTLRTRGHGRARDRSSR